MAFNKMSKPIWDIAEHNVKHGRILLFARRIYEKRTRNLKYVAKI